MTASRDLVEAHTLTRRAETLWPTARHNLIGLQAGYPVAPSDNPHHCPCHGQCDCPCPICACDTKLTPVEAAALQPDPCRQALRTVDVTIARCVAVCCELLDVGTTYTLRSATGTHSRLHALVRLLELAGRLELTPYALRDTRLAYVYARTIHDTTTRWAFEPHPVTAVVMVGVEALDWCANHSRHGIHDEPVSPRAVADGKPLCEFCWSYQRNDPRHRRPPLELVQKRRHRKLTSRDVA